MNKYIQDHFYGISEKGLTPDLCQLAKDDAEIFMTAKIESDEQRNLYLYLDNFIDDLLEEFGVSNQNREKITIESFNKLKNKEKIDLTDIRKAVYDSMDHTLPAKKAYPNFLNYGTEKFKPVYDVEKWIQSLNNIYQKMYNGEGRENSSNEVLEGWSNMEKRDFNNWSKFYENKDHQKYSIKTAALLDDIPQYNDMPVELPNTEVFPIEEPLSLNEIEKRQGPGRPKGSGLPKTPEQQKKSLVDKLMSAEKVLQQFSNVWPPKVWKELYDTLAYLRGQVLMVQLASTQRDCIIRTANKWNSLGFSEGAEVLTKIADDVTSEIADAIQGKKEKPAAPAAELPAVEPLPEAPAAPLATEEMAPMEMPPAGAAEELPPPEAPPEPEEEPKEELPENPLEPVAPIKSHESENPYMGKTIEDVVVVLEPTAQQLSERSVVRELTKADMMLDALNIASHFPELGEAIAKMIESTLYVHTRLEKVISKLKGGLSEGGTKAKSSEAPVVEMNELTEEKPNEKEMFEVSEEEPIK